MLALLEVGAGRYVTAVLVATAGVAYAGLYIVHQHYLSQLGISSAEVGLDRSRLLGGPVFGLAVVSLLSAVGIFVVAGLFWLGSSLGANVAAERSRALRMSVAVAILAGAGVGFYFAAAAADPSPALLGLCYLVGIFGWAAVLGVLDTSTPTRPWSRDPQHGANRVFLLTGAVLASGVALAFMIGWVSAAEDARLVREGSPAAGRDLFGLPLIDSDAHRIRFDPRQLDVLDPDARRHYECLLYLGRSSAGEVLWDVRRQQALRVALPSSAFEVTGSRRPVARHCAPDPQPADERRLLTGRAVVGVRSAGGAVGWQERVRGRWVGAIARPEAWVARLHPSLPRRPRWDLGPGARDGTVAAVAASCGPRRCRLLWWPVAADAAHRLRIVRGDGCALSAIAATGAALAVAWSGPHCRRRGLWLQRDGRWRTLAAIHARERITSVDLSANRAAWISRIDGDWLVATRALPRSGRRRLAVDHTVLSGGELTVTAVAIAGTAVRWNESWTYGPSGRNTEVYEADLATGRCTLLLTSLPGRPDGSGVDAAVVGRRVVYARGRVLAWHPRFRHPRPIDCGAAFTLPG